MTGERLRAVASARQVNQGYDYCYQPFMVLYYGHPKHIHFGMNAYGDSCSLPNVQGLSSPP